MATTTMSDLPRDALVLICRSLFDTAKTRDRDGPVSLRRPHEMHKKLRRVSREWRDAADMAFIEFQDKTGSFNMWDVRYPDTWSARFPSLIHRLCVACSQGTPVRACGAFYTGLTLSSLCASPDVRRVLKRATLTGMCCADEGAAAVAAIAACPLLTALDLGWSMRPGHDGGDRPDILAPLAELTGLRELTLSSWPGAPPTLPDCPSLTSLALRLCSAAFAPVGSDASLGRLRSLALRNDIGTGADQPWASNDPFRLRAHLAAGVWRPHLLIGLQKLDISVSYRMHNEVWAPPGIVGGPPPTAVWAPLAPTVTALTLACDGCIRRAFDMAAGMYAGLGMLTGLRSLAVSQSRHEPCSPIDYGRVHLPHLTALSVQAHCGPPIDLARFPQLVHVDITSRQSEPLVLSSLASLTGLASLRVSGRCAGMHEPGAKPRLNLAQLFRGGHTLDALTRVSFERVTLAWDAATVRGAPSASVFAVSAAALLPSLREFEVTKDVRVYEEVRAYVVPAMVGLGVW